ncbi:MAG: hypothetical protein ACOX0M_06930 [Salinivirgaceae bacterium]|mgnify:CR=1 FL=1|jgi:glycosyltransferase involved in cell wall biosynthesis
MKKLFIISYSFPPSNAPAAQRPYSIAYYLGLEGFDVSVLSCKNQDSSLGIGVNDCNNPKSFKHYQVGGFSIKRFRSGNTKPLNNKENKKEKIGKKKTTNRLRKFIFPDKAISWFPFALGWILLHPRKFIKTTLITTSPLVTNHLLGLIVKFLFRTNWIADFRDFHYIHSIEHGEAVSFSKLHFKLEKQIIKRADKVVFISESMKMLYAEAYSKFSSKFHAIYNGYYPEEILDEKLIDKSKFSSLPIKIFYAGSFYRGVRSPFPLIEALQKLVDDGVIQLTDVIIEIAGNIDGKLLIQLEKYQLYQQISFIGQIPREKVLEKLADSHLLWLIVGEAINHSAGIPLKSFEYIASTRPVLCFAPEGTETTNVVEELNAGWRLSNDLEDKAYNVEVLKRIFVDKLYTKSNSSSLIKENKKYSRYYQALAFGQLVK